MMTAGVQWTGAQPALWPSEKQGSQRGLRVGEGSPGPHRQDAQRETRVRSKETEVCVAGWPGGGSRTDGQRERPGLGNTSQWKRVEENENVRAGVWMPELDQGQQCRGQGRGGPSSSFLPTPHSLVCKDPFFPHGEIEVQSPPSLHYNP